VANHAEEGDRIACPPTILVVLKGALDVHDPDPLRRNCRRTSLWAAVLRACGPGAPISADLHMRRGRAVEGDHRQDSGGQR